MAVTQRDKDHKPSYPSNLSAAWIPDGQTGQKVTLTVVASTDSVLTGYDVWAGPNRQQLALQSSGSGQPPTTISVAGPLRNWTQGLPEKNAWGVLMQVKKVHHAGIAGLLVHSVTAPNQIQCLDFYGSTDNWIGQYIFVCSNIAGDVPLWNFMITAFDPSTGTLTVSPNCASADPTQSVQAGDVLIVYAQATAADSGSISAMWNNSVNRQQFPGSAGLDPGVEKGRIVRIMRNTGAGQWRYVTDNDNATHQIWPPWDVVPDTTSLFIVEDPAWVDPSDTSKQLVAPTASTSIQLHTEVANLKGEVALVGGFLVDNNGKRTDDQYAAYRMIYVFGQPPTVRTLGPGTLDGTGAQWKVFVTDQVIRVDSSANDITVILLPLTEYQGRGLLVVNLGPNAAHIYTTSPDTFPDGSTSYTIAAAGGTARITAGGVYSA